MPPPIVQLEGVSRSYRDGERTIHALRGIDLEIEPGTAAALMGQSGSGKSTLLHLMGALEVPSAGRIAVEGRPLHEMTDRELTRLRLTRIGFVFQFFHLLPTLTVLENLTLPAELSGLRGERAVSRARELAAAVGVEARLNLYPDRLSGGEQQRVAIARSLMLEPPLLLADEPTGNLDSETGGRVLELLFGAARERATTLVMATHSEEAARLASRRIVLHDGRIAADTRGEPGDAPISGPSPRAGA